MFTEFSTYKSFIFDYDNTIAKIPIDWIDARKNFRIFLQSNFPNLELKSNMRVDQMERDALLGYPEKIDLILSFRKDLENSLIGTHEVIPSTAKLIKNLDSSDLFIVSNNLRDTVLNGLNQIGLSKNFKIVIGVDDAGMPKPSLNSWELLAKLQPGIITSTLFIGDSEQTDGIFCQKIGIPFFNINTLHT